MRVFHHTCWRGDVLFGAGNRQTDTNKRKEKKSRRRRRRKQQQFFILFLQIRSTFQGECWYILLMGHSHGGKWCWSSATAASSSCFILASYPTSISFSGLSKRHESSRSFVRLDTRLMLLKIAVVKKNKTRWRRRRRRTQEMVDSTLVGAASFLLRRWR